VDGRLLFHDPVVSRVARLNHLGSAVRHLRYDDFATNWFAPGGLVMPTESALNQTGQITQWAKRDRAARAIPLENSQAILM